MKLPVAVDVIGTRWDIIYFENSHETAIDGCACDGQVDWNKCQIRLYKGDRVKEPIMVVAWHEVVHILGETLCIGPCFKSYTDEEEAEKNVERLGTALATVRFIYAD
jgi:hypothetical protein